MFSDHPNFLYVSTTLIFCTFISSQVFDDTHQPQYFANFCHPTFLSQFYNPLYLVIYYAAYHPTLLNVRTTPSIHYSLSKHQICPILPVSMTITVMLDNITTATLNEHKNDWQWNQPFLFHDGKQTLDLSKPISNSVISPPGASNQPMFFPKWSRYRFDPELCLGVDAIP